MTQDTISTNPPAAAPAPAPRLPRDMTRLHVSPEHVQAGTPGDPQCCAAAIALLDALGLPAGFEDVWVREDAIQISSGPWAVGDWWAETPGEMIDFLGQFDALDIIAVPEAGRDHLAALARDGLLQWDLTWHEGLAPAEVAEDDT